MSPEKFDKLQVITTCLLLKCTVNHFNPYICNYIAISKLTISLPYKQFIAGLLLLLYSFIAMPVQCWHHHNYPASSKKIALTKQDISFEKSTGQTADTSCSICAHQYSVYSQAATTPYKIDLPVIRYRYNTFIASIPETPYLHSSNKGPPTTG